MNSTLLGRQALSSTGRTIDADASLIGKGWYNGGSGDVRLVRCRQALGVEALLTGLLVDEGRFRLQVDGLLLELLLTGLAASRRSIGVVECLVLLVVVVRQVVLITTTLRHHVVKFQACRRVALRDARLLRHLLVEFLLMLARVFIVCVRDVRII